jgi:hypothetical protein
VRKYIISLIVAVVLWCLMIFFFDLNNRSYFNTQKDWGICPMIVREDKSVFWVNAYYLDGNTGGYFIVTTYIGRPYRVFAIHWQSQQIQQD